MIAGFKGEILISSFIFVFSLAGTLFAYFDIHRLKTSDQVLIREIEEGEHSYIIKNSAGCIGELSVNFSRPTDTFQINAGGFLRISAGTAAFKPEYSLTATFNSIGQLGGSLLRISADGASFSIGTTDINPIRVVARVNSDGSDIHRELQMTGPVEMKENKNGSYRVEYSQLRTFREHGKNIIGSETLRSFSFSLVPAEDKAAECPQGEVSMDLSAGISSMFGIINNINTDLRRLGIR